MVAIADPNAVPAAQNGSSVHQAPVMVPVQAAPPLSVPPAATPATQPQVQFVRDDAAIAAAVEAARREEKQKLYPDLEAVRAELAQAREALKAKMSPDERVLAENAELRNQLGAMSQQLQSMQQVWTEQFQAERNARVQSELEGYRSRRVAEVMQSGVKLLPEFVQGPYQSVQEIEQAIHNATVKYVEYSRMFAPITPGLPVGVSMAPQQYVPSPFPQVPNAPPVTAVDAGAPGFASAVRDWTSPEAIRSGEYAKHRAEAMNGLRQHGGAPPVGASFATAPRYSPNAPMPQQQYGAVQQPQGLPTPAYYPQQMVQPQMLPPQPTQVNYAQPGMAPPGVQQMAAQYAQQGGDINQMRQAAIDAARTHLQNPGAVQAPTTQPTGHLPAAVPNPGASFDGQHPMIRNNFGGTAPQ